MKEKILKFYYLNMISLKCSPVLFKHSSYRIFHDLFRVKYSIVIAMEILNIGGIDNYKKISLYALCEKYVLYSNNSC